MREIRIKLWYHLERENWSVEIDGSFYKHVSAKAADELVEFALVTAEEALLEPESTLKNAVNY